MQVALLPWREKKRLFMFLGSLVQLHGTKGTLTTSAGSRVRMERASGDNGTRISGHMRRLCKQNLLKEALDILRVMDQEGIRPDCSIYSSLLQVCVNKKALPEGKLVHAHMIDTGMNADVFLETKLVIMYVKCGSLVDARRVLDEMPVRNVVSWTAMIAGYARHGQSEEALILFYQMQRTGIQPDQFSFASVLPACANLEALEHGKRVHESIIRSGFQADAFVASALMDMYLKCGIIKDALQVFDKMSERDVVSWNAMVAGYVQNGQVDEALKLFQKMPERDQVSWNAIIVGHAQEGHVDEALKLFHRMTELNVVSWNTMIAGFVQNGHVEEGLALFQKMPEQNVVSWNTMLAGYAQNGYFDEALMLFRQMQLKGVKPNPVTFASILPACANLTVLKRGKEVHEDIIRSGFQYDIFVGNALVDMYAKCGSIGDASKVFNKISQQNVVSWTAMIVGYPQNGHLDIAQKQLQKMPGRNVISWNTMIAGYAKNGHFNKALNLFRQMQLSGMKPNSITFATVLPACANLAALEHGKEVHGDIVRTGFQSYLFVENALVDMYAKCGCIDSASKVFNKMPDRDIVSWNAMIVGYAMHGYSKDALDLFDIMQHSGMKPSHVTLVGVLSACCHAGLVDDGWEYFDHMSQDYHITPAVEHYCCMVDLLGRAGHLAEAYDFIKKMPIKPDVAVWVSLLGACKIHSNIELGERVAECLFESDPKNAAHYVLLSNIHAAAGRWADVERVRNLMKERGVQKKPGCSWIEANNRVYPFFVGDRSHPQAHKIYAKLERLSCQMKKVGYVPDTIFVLDDADEQTEHYLLGFTHGIARSMGS